MTLAYNLAVLLQNNTSTFTITGNTPSTSTTTGALVVAGGAGVGGNINVGGSVTIGGVTINSTNLVPQSYQVVANGISAAYTLSFTPIAVTGMIVTIDGLVEYDYTLSTNVLTFGFVPANNSIIRIFSMGIPGLVSTATIAPGTVGTSSFQAGAILGGLGYTPVNKAGDSLTGSFTLNGGAISSGTEWLSLALSDEVTAVTTGTAKVTLRLPYAVTFYQIPRASLTTTTTGATVIDVRVNGSSILGATKLTIDSGALTSVTSATPTTLATTTAIDDAQVILDVYNIAVGAKGLKVTIYFRKA
jgi:hypothetical protein